MTNKRCFPLIAVDFREKVHKWLKCKNLLLILRAVC
jgi:hypothetical protein